MEIGTKLLKNSLITIFLAIILMAFLACSSQAPSSTVPPTTASPIASSSQATMQPIKLTCATWEGTQGSSIPALLALVKELEEKSNGKITVDIAYGAVMATPAEHYNLAVTGVADISHGCPSYTPGRFPMAEIVELPIARASEVVYSQSYWELYKKGYFDEDFKDVKVLYLGCPGPFDLQMGKIQINTFEDISGKKIRASGKMHTEIVKSFGAIPVGMPGPEIYVSLEKGVIDGSFTPWSFMKSFRTEKVTKSVIEIGVAANDHVIVMSKKAYNSLPDDIRAMLDNVGDKLSTLLGQSFANDTNEARDIIYKNAGGQILQLSKADMEKIDKALAPIWKNWIDEGEAKGLHRKNMVAELYNILKAKGVEQPFHGYSP